MRNFAIITAAGKSTRFGRNKALYPLLNKPVLIWSIEIFTQLVEDIIVTFPEELRQDFVSAISSFHNVKLISGGETRSDSVRKAFESIHGEGIVLIHDAARPLVSRSLAESVLTFATEKKAVIPVLPISETVKELDQNRIVQTLSRDKLALAQTPQGFHTSVLKEAYSRIQRSDLTDEAMLAELSGTPVFTVPGESMNLKITEPSDIALAEFYLSKGVH